SNAAEPQGVLPEAPRAHERPGEVFRRIAGMSKFPINDAGEAPLSNQEVSNAEVAVNHDVGALGRKMITEPPYAQLDRRVRLFERVDLAVHAVRRARRCAPFTAT